MKSTRFYDWGEKIKTSLKKIQVGDIFCFALGGQNLAGMHGVAEHVQAGFTGVGTAVFVDGFDDPAHELRVG